MNYIILQYICQYNFTTFLIIYTLIYYFVNIIFTIIVFCVTIHT